MSRQPQPHARPDTIDVNPYTYRVKEDLEACIAADAQGVCLDDQGVIIVNPALKAIAARDTLLHEVLHAVWMRAGLQTDFDHVEKDSPGERIINVVATGLLQVLRDNPQFVEYLTS